MKRGTRMVRSWYSVVRFFFDLSSQGVAAQGLNLYHGGARFLGENRGQKRERGTVPSSRRPVVSWVVFGLMGGSKKIKKSRQLFL